MAKTYGTHFLEHGELAHDSRQFAAKSLNPENTHSSNPKGSQSGKLTRLPLHVKLLSITMSVASLWLV